jgi:hypothetical protein
VSAADVTNIKRGQVERYAVMIPFDDEMLFVTQGDGKFQLGARLFDTEQKAEEHAALWGKNAVVVEYLEEQGK